MGESGGRRDAGPRRALAVRPSRLSLSVPTQVLQVSISAAGEHECTRGRGVVALLQKKKKRRPDSAEARPQPVFVFTQR